MRADIRQYLVVTGNYWAFTLTDGALRMLIVLHFYQLRYTPLAIASLFLFYEFFGIVTNLVGGWLGARLGLNKTMNLGLFLQIVALSMLLVPADALAQGDWARITQLPRSAAARLRFRWLCAKASTAAIRRHAARDARARAAAGRRNAIDWPSVIVRASAAGSDRPAVPRTAASGR